MQQQYCSAASKAAHTGPISRINSLFIDTDAMNDGTEKSLTRGDKAVRAQVSKLQFKRMLTGTPKVFYFVTKHGGTCIGNVTSKNLNKGVVCVRPSNLAYKAVFVRLSAVTEIHFITPLCRKRKIATSAQSVSKCCSWVSGKGYEMLSADKVEALANC